MCPLLAPRPPSTTRTPARRTRIGGGAGSAHGFSSYSISFLSLLACFAVAKGGKRGMGLRFQSQICLGRIRHPHQIIYRTRSPAQPSPAQPCAIRFNPSELLLFLFRLLAYSKTRFNVVFITIWGPGPLFRLGSLVLCTVCSRHQPACRRTPTAARPLQNTALHYWKIHQSTTFQDPLKSSGYPITILYVLATSHIHTTRSAHLNMLDSIGIIAMLRCAVRN